MPDPPPVDPPPDPLPGDNDLPGDLLGEAGNVRGDLAMIQRAAAAGWFDDPRAAKLLKSLPTKILLIASSGDFPVRERLSAARTLMVVLRSLENVLAGRAVGPGGAQAPGGGPSVAIQQNFGVGFGGGAGWIVATQEQVAEFFGRSPETIKDWRAKGMPGAAGGPGIPGAYDLREILAWRDANVGASGRDDLPSRPGHAAISRAEADRRKALADAQRAELRVQRERHEVIEVAAVVREYQHHATHARALLEQLPNRLMGELPEDATADDKRRFRDKAQRVVDDVVRAMHADLVERARAAQAELDAARPDQDPGPTEPDSE